MNLIVDSRAEWLERLIFEDPLEHYRFCRSLLLRCPREEELHQEFQKALLSPFSSSFQPSVAALALVARKLKRSFPPIVPRLLASGVPEGVVPFQISQEMASLWRELGLQQEADRLSAAIQKFSRSAQWLYFREASFRPPLMSQIAREGSAADPSLGIANFSSSKIDSSFTLTGWNTGLGALLIEDLVIASFGPQTALLSDPSGFGVAHQAAVGALITTEKKGVELEGWSRLYGHRESWIWFKAKAGKEAIEIEISHEAAPPSLQFVFYIQAKSCTLETGESLVAGSLQRYQGKAVPIFLNGRVRFEGMGRISL